MATSISDPAAGVSSSGPSRRVALLDEDGAITVQLEQVLLEIFLKYATSNGQSAGSRSSTSSTDTPNTALKVGDAQVQDYVLTQPGLDRFGMDTNGQVLPPEQVSGGKRAGQGRKGTGRRLSSLAGLAGCLRQANTTGPGRAGGLTV